MRGTTNLLLDLDNCRRANIAEIKRRLRLCGLQPVYWKIRRSPSGRGIHVLIGVKGKFVRRDIVALQSICGSDPIREAHNFQRAGLAGPEWGDDWQVLFERKKNETHS